MKIGNLTLNGVAALAPMAGATDTTMRRLCAAHGAVCTVSEMVSAKALTMGDKKSPRLMAGGGGDAPFGVQLFGAQYAMRVWLDGNLLNKYNLTPVDVINALKVQNDQIAAG